MMTARDDRGRLRVITCGSAGDGKSMLLDRLARESSQRRFVVADTPRGEHCIRDIVAGASTADAAIVLVDARKGVQAPTHRHSYILSLFGIRHVVLAVDNMDLVAYSQSIFDGIATAYRALARQMHLGEITCIPVSAVHGDNVVAPRGNTDWYRGPMLLEHLDTVAIDDDLRTRPFRMPVDSVKSPSRGLRGYCGTIVSGSVEPGDRVVVQPAGLESRVARIVGADGDASLAIAHQSIMLALDDEIDARRGDVVSAADHATPVADQFEASVVWIGAKPMLRGRRYLMTIGTRTVNATVAPLKYKVNVDSLEHVAADKLEQDEIGVCVLELDHAIAFEPYTVNRDLGGFILVDRMTGDSVAAGQLRFALRRSQNIHWQAFDIDRAARASLKGQQPCVLWFTGLSGAGKSTIANLVDTKLHALGRHTYVLDGDNVRKGLSKDLGFTAADRVENIRRVAEVAALMADAGLIVLTAFISPFRDERSMARALMPRGGFLEIFVDTPLAVAEQRDSKGLYRKARRGQLANFTGIDSPYERPVDAEITIDGAAVAAVEAADRIIDELRQRGIIDA